MTIHPTPYPHVLNALNGPAAPKHTFLVFYSNVVDGQMWCPDCRRVEDTVNKTFQGDDKPKAVLYWVGNKEEWRQPKNKARVDYNVQSIPTIVRLENGKETARLTEDDILDSARLKEFVYPDGRS